MINTYVLEDAYKFVARLRRRDPTDRKNTFEVIARQKHIHIRVSGCLCFTISPIGDIYGVRSGTQSPKLTEFYGSVAYLSKSSTWRRRGIRWDGYRLTVPWYNHRYRGNYRIADFNRSNPRGY